MRDYVQMIRNIDQDPLGLTRLSRFPKFFYFTKLLLIKMNSFVGWDGSSRKGVRCINS